MGESKPGQTNLNPKDSSKVRQDMVAAEIAARDLARDLGYALENLKESTNQLQKQVGITEQLKKGTKALNSLAQNNANIAKDLAAMYDSEVQANNNLLLKRNMISTGLKGDYAQMLTTYMLENNITDLNSRRAQLLIQELKKRQHINEHTEKQVELMEEMASWQEEMNEEVEGYMMKWEKLKSKVLAVITDPQVRKSFLTAKGIEAIKEGFEETVDVMKEIRSEGFTMTQVIHETEVASGALLKNFFTSGASLKDNAQIMAAMRKEMGSVHDISSETVGEIGKLSKTLGISAQQAGQLQGQFQSMAGNTAESATNTIEYAGALAKAAGVAPGDVMADIAANSEATAQYAKDGGKNIATAAVAAKKLGIEFSTMNKMADGLLDFETSINKQMEASVLLGKEINLDKAREAALNGDLVGATEEMLKNVGGEAEFNKMNVVQRKALADSMGVSVQELSKMVKNQDKLKDLTEEQQEALKDGTLSLDEALGNAKGVGERMWEGAKGAGAMFLNIGGMASSLKDSLNTTKGLLKGFKDGAGFAGKIGGAFKGGLKGAEAGGDKVSDAADKAKGASDKTDKVKTKGGFKDSMKNLADGFKEMGSGKVLAGIMNTLVAGPALVVALPAIPFLLFMGMVPLKQLGDNFLNLAMGLEFMGSGKVAMGVGVMALAGPALALGVLALPFLAFMSIPAVGKGIEAGLKGLAAGMTTLGNPATAIAILIGIGLLAAFGAALIPLTYAVSLLTPVLEAMGNIIIGVMQAIPPIITAIADGFVKMFGAVNMDNIGPLLLLGPALIGIGMGLAVMSAAGLGALPIIGALVALGVVAPALTGLANALFGGGGGEGEKDDKMDLLIEEVRSLKTEMASITVNLDGKKVGDALRGSMNTSRVR